VKAPLGLSNVDVTRLGFGAAQIGNLYSAIEDDDARAAVDAAWEAGIRYFDTAPHYGLGLSERRLGAALRGRPRAEYVVSTKVGRLLVANDAPFGPDDAGFDVTATHRRVWDFSRDGVRRSIADSLNRLGLDRIDIAYLHDPDNHVEWALREGYPALAELRDEGVLAAIGVGMNQCPVPALFVRETDLDVVMLAGRYTLLEQPALDELLPLCTEHGVSVVAAGIYNSGLLARSRPDDAAMYNYTTAPPELIARTHRIADVCERHHVALPAAALRFPLSHPAVASAVVGCRTPAQVNDAVRRWNTTIPQALWEDLRAEGLIDQRTPQ
jgi:D-threo-aldose 1-dehydrogenase